LVFLLLLELQLLLVSQPLLAFRPPLAFHPPLVFQLYHPFYDDACDVYDGVFYDASYVHHLSFELKLKV